MNKRRFVVDNNILVSRLLLPESIPAQAVRLAVNLGILLISDDTLQELSTVLSRSKFDAYVSARDRQEFIQRLIQISERVEIIQQITACRDPKDDKFLELAVNGKAESIITGDKDLLTPNPFMEVRIITPRKFLIEQFS